MLDPSGLHLEPEGPRGSAYRGVSVPYGYSLVNHSRRCLDCALGEAILGVAGRDIQFGFDYMICSFICVPRESRSAPEDAVRPEDPCIRRRAWRLRNCGQSVGHIIVVGRRARPVLTPDLTPSTR